MNQLKQKLNKDYDKIAQLKSTLEGLKDLVIQKEAQNSEKEVSLTGLAQLNEKIELVESNLGELRQVPLFTTYQSLCEDKSISNDKLFIQLKENIIKYNSDVDLYNAGVFTSKSVDEQQQEFLRLHLAQVQMNQMLKHLSAICNSDKANSDRALSKALIGSAFVWYERISSNLVPLKPHELIDKPKIKTPSKKQLSLSPGGSEMSFAFQNDPMLATVRNRKDYGQRPISLIIASTKPKKEMRTNMSSFIDRLSQPKSARKFNQRHQSVKPTMKGSLAGPGDNSTAFTSDKMQTSRNLQLLNQQSDFSTMKRQQSITPSNKPTSSEPSVAMKLQFQPQSSHKNTPLKSRPPVNKMPIRRTGNVVKNMASHSFMDSSEDRDKISELNKAIAEYQLPNTGRISPTLLGNKSSSRTSGYTSDSKASKKSAAPVPAVNIKFPLIQPPEHALMSKTIGESVKFIDMAKKDSVGISTIDQDQSKPGGILDLMTNLSNLYDRKSSIKHRKFSHGAPYITETIGKQDVVKTRPAQMTSRIIDMTHDTLPELQWRPARRETEKVPPPSIMEDKVLLRDWENTQADEFFAFNYDRRYIDFDVFKKFQANGEIIKMVHNQQDLTKDKNFWKSEQDITNRAKWHIRQFKQLKPYDNFKLEPQTYDVKLLTQGNKNIGEKKGEGGDDKKDSKTDDKKAKKDDPNKTSVTFAEPVAESKSKKSAPPGQTRTTFGYGSENEDEEEEDFDLQRQLQTNDHAKKSMQQIATENYAAEVNVTVPVFSRGPEIEYATIREAEDLKRVLAQDQINLSHKVITRAIVIPKDEVKVTRNYPDIMDSLMINPYATEEYKRKLKEEKLAIKKAERKEKKANSKKKKSKQKNKDDPLTVLLD